MCVASRDARRRRSGCSAASITHASMPRQSAGVRRRATAPSAHLSLLYVLYVSRHLLAVCRSPACATTEPNELVTRSRPLWPRSTPPSCLELPHVAPQQRTRRTAPGSAGRSAPAQGHYPGCCECCRTRLPTAPRSSPGRSARAAPAGSPTASSSRSAGGADRAVAMWVSLGAAEMMRFSPRRVAWGRSRAPLTAVGAVGVLAQGQEERLSGRRCPIAPAEQPSRRTRAADIHLACRPRSVPQSDHFLSEDAEVSPPTPSQSAMAALQQLRCRVLSNSLASSSSALSLAQRFCRGPQGAPCPALYRPGRQACVQTRALLKPVGGSARFSCCSFVGRCQARERTAEAHAADLQLRRRVTRSSRARDARCRRALHSRQAAHSGCRPRRRTGARPRGARTRMRCSSRCPWRRTCAARTCSWTCIPPGWRSRSTGSRRCPAP